MLDFLRKIIQNQRNYVSGTAVAAQQYIRKSYESYTVDNYLEKIGVDVKGVMPMDKKVLEDYIDACEFIKETEEEIKSLKKKRKIVIDKVRGSNPEFPYQPQSFGIAGTTETYKDKDLIQSEEHILKVQKKRAEELKIDVEEWMKEIPFRMQRIIRYKFFNRLSWEEVATLMGRKCTGASVRMEYQRFMEEK